MGVLVLLLSVAAAPPVRLPREEASGARERNARQVEALAMWKRGQRKEAVALTEEALADRLRVYGPWHRLTETAARRLAGWRQAMGDWKREAECRKVVLESRRRLWGEDGWRTTDARLELEEAQAQPGRTPAQREAMRRAEALRREAGSLRAKGQGRKAVPLAAQALKLAEGALGREHPRCAAFVAALAEASHAAVDTAGALPLYREALGSQRAALGRFHPACAHTLDNLGMLRAAMGDRRAALPLHQEALAIRRKALGPRHADCARSLDHLSKCFRDARDFPAAIRLSQEALDIRKEALGEEDPDYARSVGDLAVLRHTVGDHDAALALYQEALKRKKAASGGQDSSYAGTLASLAHLRADMGDLVEAVRLQEEAVAIRKAARGPRHPEYAASLQGLALMKQKAGETAAALRLYREAAAIRKEVLGAKHPSYALSLEGVAVLLHEKEEREAALPLFEAVVAIRQEALGEDDPLTLLAQARLGALHRDLGNFPVALPLYEKSLALAARTYGKSHASYAAALGRLGVLHLEAGDPRAALPVLEQAASLRKRILGLRHADYGEALGNLAQAHQEAGDTKAALRLFGEALAVLKAARGDRHPSVAVAMQNLGLLRSGMWDREGALPLLREAEAILGAAGAERRAEHAGTLGNLASLHHRLGEDAMALPLLEKALALRKEVLGARHPQVATALRNLAMTRWGLGQREAAYSLMRESLAIHEAALGKDHPRRVGGLLDLANMHMAEQDYAAAAPLLREAVKRCSEGGRARRDGALLGYLAFLHGGEGRPGSALPLAEQALAITGRQQAVEAGIQSERQQLAAKAGRAWLDTRLSLPDEAARFSHGHVLAWKGAAFAAQQARRAFVRAQGDPATKAVAQELLDATRSLALLSRLSDRESRKRAEALVLRKEALEVRLAESSDAFRASLRPPSSEAFRAALPVGVVLVDLLAYRGRDPQRPWKGQEAKRRLAAWVLRADAETVRVDLGPLGPIEEDVAAWRSAIERDRDPGELPARLRKLVWAPLEKHLEGAAAVLVSPDSALGRLPFAALPGGKEGTFLIEEKALALLPIPQALAGLLAPVAGEPSLLVVGGVAFGEGKPWDALPATGPEADAVAARFKGAATSLSGEKATRAALREALPRHRFAHLATHGYFAPASMKPATDADDGKPLDRLGREGVAGWNPALLSGLVFAGANKPAGADDGVLTASEIGETDLSRMELAVLSACQSGLGKEAGGEGMLGMQRAFAMAGCKSVVSSLWSVHDSASAVLMERFYHHLWEKKLTKIEAMRQAQLDVLRHPEWVEARMEKMRGIAGLRGVGKAAEKVPGKAERRSPPAWWAAWQLSGDWR